MVGLDFGTESDGSLTYPKIMVPYIEVYPFGLGKYNREPSTEPKEPSTGTEKTGTEKFRFYFGSTF